MNNFSFHPVPIHRKQRYFRGQVVIEPASFRHPHRVKPTPGGRYKIRKLTNGKWRVYAESPLSNRAHRLHFEQWQTALLYATILAEIAHSSPNEKVRYTRSRTAKQAFRDNLGGNP